MNYSEIKERIQLRISQQIIDPEILNLLIPNGKPHNKETNLFDYKSSIPILPDRPSSAERDHHTIAIDGIIKDVVAFHNVYGGFIIFGVHESEGIPKHAYGIKNELDISSLCTRLKSVTRCSIDIQFDILEYEVEGKALNFGVLLIPKRIAAAHPVTFIKAGKGKTYAKGATYGRFDDQCRPVESNHSDWSFILSPREAKTDISAESSYPELKNNLPAKDSDLIEFVGRSDILEELRKWFINKRDPIRLLSGIGGLGKTTIATKFAEEVVVSRTTGVDRVVWLTAKAKTYSALRGKLIKTPETHFSNVPGLFKKLITEIAGSGYYDEDIEDDELSSVLQDVLQYEPSLIIIDDLDSLDPDQQTEAVRQLNSVGSFTVGRDYNPSHILMTSRLELGLPKTQIISVSGFELEVFEDYIGNLCGRFKLQTPNRRTIKKIFQTTNGSPLFAASLVRLASLGESFADICETWKGEESENVRRFALERELDRLNTSARLTLLAILELDNASTDELARVVDTMPKKVKDDISELQGFHLLEDIREEAGTVRYSASRDLINVKSILKGLIGDRANPVIRNCNRITKGQVGDQRTVSIAIRDVVDLWRRDETEKALALATETLARYPNQPDLMSIVGAAYLKSSPPNFEQANRYLSNAQAAGCNRIEQLENLVITKVGIEDWRGIEEIANDVVLRGETNETIIVSLLKSKEYLSKIAFERREYSASKKLAYSGLEIIHQCNKNLSIKTSVLDKIIVRKDNFIELYANSSLKSVDRPADKLGLFRDFYSLLKVDALGPNLSKLMSKALAEWWLDVESRETIDDEAKKLAADQVSRIRDVISVFRMKDKSYATIISVLESDLRKLTLRIMNSS